MLEEALQGYLLTRRLIYDQLDDLAQLQQFQSVWDRHQAFDWTVRKSPLLAKAETLFDEGIVCIGHIISEPVTRRDEQHILLYNADTRSRYGQSTVNLFAISSRLDDEELPGLGEPDEFEQMYREGE